MYNRWVIGGYDKEISLNDFKDKLLNPKKTTEKTKTAEEVETTADEIFKMFNSNNSLDKLK